MVGGFRMEWAATTAAGGQAALAAKCATDRDTLQRVAESLRSQLAGVDPLSRHQHLELPAHTIEHRTCTLLEPLSFKGFR
jgi:hypothetical protein